LSLASVFFNQLAAFARSVLTKLEQYRPWSMAEFDQARTAAEKLHPSVFSLWEAIQR